MSAVSVMASTASIHEAGPGSTPRAALQSLQVKPIAPSVARQILEKRHYLGSLPGGTKLPFGIFLGNHLVGVLTMGVGPANAHRLVEGAEPHDCITLTRLWLSDQLPPNSESRVLGVVLRLLKRHTELKFVVTYADPARGHMGTIYQATGWRYTGLSQATALFDLGDGKRVHSRTLAHIYGTHSVQHFAQHNIQVKLIAQQAKHRYIYFLDPTWRHRLGVSEMAYPKADR